MIKNRMVLGMETFEGLEEDVAVGIYSALLSQPPSVIRKESLRDLELVSIAKEAMAEIEAEAAKKSGNKIKGRSVING